jgi:hypothetical protein
MKTREFYIDRLDKWFCDSQRVAMRQTSQACSFLPRHKNVLKKSGAKDWKKLLINKFFIVEKIRF